jgi:hypothetical protein
MKLTHSYNAPLLPELPENPRPDEEAAHGQIAADRDALLQGQLHELGHTVLLHLLQQPGDYVISWHEPEEIQVDPATVKVTLAVDMKRYREPKKEGE